MNKTKWLSMAVVPVLVMSMTACAKGNDGGRVVIQEPGRTITVVEEPATETGDLDISVEGIQSHENVEISGWLDNETVIVSMENKSLDKMSLAELADSYPRSLYLYHIGTRQFELLKEQKEVFLSGAGLSPDKKHLVYQAYNLGDPVFYMMDMDTLDTTPLTGGSIGGAMSAGWGTDGTVIGAAYSGGAYRATVSGDIGTVPGMEGELLVIAKGIGDSIYYNTNADGTLKVMDLATGAKTSLGLENVYGVYPSPDGKQLLVLQYNGSKSSLILCGLDGSNPKRIAEGAELGGVSWSPDQRMIAYSQKADGNATAASTLYVYDMLTGESTPIAVDVGQASTSWSPSGKELAYAEWTGSQYNSSIVTLKLSLQK
ncbi:TolB family protein [Paenibacillus sp. CAU 1782]